MSRRGWLLFGAMSVIWGLPYLLIRISVRELAPPTLVFARTVPAALLLMPIAWRRGYLRPLLANWRWVLAYTVIELGLPWLFLSSAEQRLPSSTAGLLIAAVPLAAAVIYRLTPNTDHFNRRQLLGLLVGFAGVAALVGVNVHGSNAGAVCEVGVCVVGYALGPLIISTKLQDLPSLGVVAVSIAITALVYTPFAATRWPTHVSGEVVWSVAGLALICTALAFILFFLLIREVGPARSTVITYINPAVAILLGVGLLGESLNWGIAVGFPLILLGSVLATGRRSNELRPEPAAP
jgi:drug/metabolite transporter (DMT)-like permease